MEMKIIGQKIAEARKQINLSQAELSRHLFISPQAVGKWERGESIPDLITFNRLAKLPGMDLNYFSEDFPSVTTLTDTPAAERPADIPSQEKVQPKRSWNMSRGNWVGADFSGLNNLHEKFSSSNLQRCNFTGSDLSGLLLKDNHVDSCDFSCSDLSGSHIENTHFSNNQFHGCRLKEATLSGSHIKGCDFSGADLTGTLFRGDHLSKSNIAHAVLVRTSFEGTHLADIVFNGPLEDCSFENCGFSRVTFQDATLINTFFKTRSLKGIRFIDCRADRMTYEFLKNGKADLTGITLIQTSQGSGC